MNLFLFLEQNQVYIESILTKYNKFDTALL